MKGSRLRKAELLTDYLRSAGPTANYAGALAWLRKNDSYVSEPTFYLYKKRMYPRDGGKPMTTTHETNGKHVDPAPPPVHRPALGDDLTYLERLIKFGAAVEAVGGIDVAQRLLDGLRHLKGAFK